MILLLLVSGFLNVTTNTFAVSKFRVVHSFGGTGDGVRPSSGLISDASGNLYGTTDQTGLLYQAE
jgi:hypothetical protein